MKQVVRTVICTRLYVYCKIDGELQVETVDVHEKITSERKALKIAKEALENDNLKVALVDEMEYYTEKYALDVDTFMQYATRIG